MAVDIGSLHRGTHIFSWGRGDLGQLGSELDQSEAQPVLVQAVEDKDIAHVAASVFNSAFITGASPSLAQTALNVDRWANVHGSITPVKHNSPAACSPLALCMQRMLSYGQLEVMTAVN